MYDKFKFSGIIHHDNVFHSQERIDAGQHIISPTYVNTSWGNVAQYASTVQDQNTGYNPQSDCRGYFMSSKYQPNNNCYAYACNIATNTFAQPGRKSGAVSFKNNFTAAQVVKNAQSDGLIYVGNTKSSITQFNTTSTNAGHFVALMFSDPENNNPSDPDAAWPGDYHWARLDDINNGYWSQKDGSDQVTNFDFAGTPLRDPMTANWVVNQGPICNFKPSNPNDKREYLVSYYFYCFMYVTYGKVNII